MQVFSIQRIVAEGLKAASNEMVAVTRQARANLLLLDGFSGVRGADQDPQAARQFQQQTKYVFRTGLPFLQKWNVVPYDYEAVYQQALQDLEDPNIAVSWRVSTTWGHPA